MIRRILLTVTLLVGGVGEAQAWGATGHRVTGAIAERHLTPEAADEVRDLLEPGESLAIASTWADFVRVYRRGGRRRHGTM